MARRPTFLSCNLLAEDIDAKACRRVRVSDTCFCRVQRPKSYFRIWAETSSYAFRAMLTAFASSHYLPFPARRSYVEACRMHRRHRPARPTPLSDRDHRVHLRGHH